MKTAAEFQKRMFTGFNNSQLGIDVERILTNYQDDNFRNPPISRTYDRKNRTATLRIHDSFYDYPDAKARDFDLAFLNVILKEFRLINK
jgi:hypothetical protein